jgi:hypothetical protein
MYALKMAKCYAQTCTRNMCVLTTAVSLNKFTSIYFITRKLHNIKFTIYRLSLISELFIPCILEHCISLPQLSKCTTSYTYNNNELL